MNVNFWIFGDAFLRGWYSIYDHDNNRMGFVPFIGSTKTKPVYSNEQPTLLLPGVDVNLPDQGITILGLSED